MKRSLLTFYRSLIEKTGLNQLTESVLISACITGLFTDVKLHKATLLKRAKILLIFDNNTGQVKHAWQDANINPKSNK